MAQPRNIVPVLSEEERRSGKVARATASPNVTYHGGPLLTSVEVFTVFWGDGWSQPPQAQLIDGINRFFDYVVTSPLIDALAEYSRPGNTIGHGRRVGTVTLANPRGGPGRRMTDAKVQQQLHTWVADGVLPQPTANTIFFVYLPPGTLAVDSGRKRSCTVFCGYHGNTPRGILYAVEPFLNCPGCTYGGGNLDSLTKVSSHELCEAITDPASGGWYDDATGEEIGDVCNASILQLGGYTVQKQWSQVRSTCVP